MQRKLCTRKIDELGRVVIPQEARQELKIKEKQKFDILIDEDTILLKLNKDIPTCNMCGETEELKEIGNSYICRNCIDIIKDI